MSSSFRFPDVFRDFFEKHSDTFIDAPATLGGEQNLEYYALYQKYLKLYENTLLDYISALDISMEEFYRELRDVSNDPEIKDKKLLHFVNYLVASADYESFYKLMSRAAKKARKAESKTGGVVGLGASDSKAEGKDSYDDANESKYSHK